MGKEKAVAANGSIWSELFLQTGLYKRNQGRITRQVTFAVLAVVFLVAAYQLHTTLKATYDSALTHYALPGVVLLGGWWLSFRLVNLPRFADFLIAVEAEMNKVSWPSKGELIRASLVVIFMIFFLAAILAMYDVIWLMLFRQIGVLHGGGGQ
jgi:preprotein translocase subunit SecE